MARLSGRPLLPTGADSALVVGREDQLDRLVDAVRRRLNVLLIGAAGSGATTILHQLSRRLRLTTAQHPRFVNATGMDRPEQLLDQLAGDLVPTVSVVGGSSAYTRFSRYVDLPQGLVALVDNASVSLAYDSFGRLRDEIWTVPMSWVVTCSERDRLSFLRPPADAFYEVIVDLPRLEDSSAADLLRRRASTWELSDAALTSAVQFGRGNPRELISAARSIVLEGEDPAALPADAAWRHAVRQKLSRPAAMLLEELESVGPSSASDTELQERTGWTRARLVQVFAELQKAAAVESDEVRSGTNGRPRKVFRPTKRAHGEADSGTDDT